MNFYHWSKCTAQIKKIYIKEKDIEIVFLNFTFLRNYLKYVNQHFDLLQGK